MNDDKKFFDQFYYMYIDYFRSLTNMVLRPVINHGITMDEFRVLHDVSEAKDKIQVKEIANKHNVTRPAISRVVGKLLHKKYIIQVVDETDRRSKFLQLTDEGSKVKEIIYNEMIQRNRKQQEVFSRTKQVQLLKLTEEYMNSFQIDDE